VILGCGYILRINCAGMAGDRPGQPAYDVFLAQNVHFQEYKFLRFKFKMSSIRRSQIWVLFQDALLFYCMLYTDCQSGKTAAIAHHM